MPDLNKYYFHIPTVVPMTGKINISNDLETDLEGLYVAGESAGLIGILSAAMTGSHIADRIL